MKRLFFGILFLAVVQLGWAQGNEEFRANWVVDFSWLTPGNSVEESQALIREILDNHQKANFTSVLWQVRRFGSTYYPSAIEPWGPEVGFQDPGFDPLAYALQEAHARGLEFHAWFNTFESRFAYPGSPSQRNPDWVCRDQSGIVMPTEIAWLSPGIPEVREYLLEVAMEIVNTYDIDGLHLDFVRWNEHENSGASLALVREKTAAGVPDGLITPAQLEQLKSNASGRYLYDVDHPFSGGIPGGFASWEEWWRWTVTEFVSSLHDSIQAVKPWVRLSPAALGRYNWGGWQGFDIVYQDAALWLNEGYIDQLVGMHYHWSNATNIYNILEGGCPQCWSQFIQPGIQAGRLYSVGLFSDSFAENNLFGRHPSIVDTVRSIDWADGFQFFSYRSWRDQNYWEEARKRFFQRKTKIRATGLFDAIPPEAPAITLNKLDSLNYQITVTPPASISENLWFAVYRSEDAGLEVAGDEIIQVSFGETTFSHTDQFDGLQDYDDQYWYFATALDRYWNESAPSNGAVSDPIPSFAPTVIATSPAPGDTIPVSSQFEITFSKTMNVGSLAGALSFEPAATIGELGWSEDQNRLTVSVEGDLAFATDYTLTIAPTALDVNGKALDGNEDGSEGDSFQLSFTTLERDLAGPQLVSSFPDYQVPSTDFTIDEVITLVFDEFLDPTSVSETSLTLTSGGSEVPIEFEVHDLEEFSILSIQSQDPLENNRDYTLTVSTAVTDTLGNPLAETINFSFRTSAERYLETESIEDFRFPGTWWQPNGSGSTVGIVVAGSKFGITADVVPPATRPKKSGFLTYQWDENASEFLLREYLAGGAPRNVQFDSTYVLQCYVFGDGSNNKFRFAVDDAVPTGGANNHEVSAWIPLDWIGWRIVEWDMGDPNEVGEWLGDQILEGTLRFDSFQLTHEAGDGLSGKIYFDNLRLVKKTTQPVSIADQDRSVPERFQLYQNYPNPFNPTTLIAFDLPEGGLTTLKIYDLLGREVKTLLNEHRSPGRYRFQFDAADLASGMYLYRLSQKGRSVTRRMLLVK